MIEPFEYKYIHLQNTHVHPSEEKQACSWFTDNLLWHTLTTISLLFEKLVWIPEHNDRNQFIFMSLAKFQWSWTFRAKHLCDNLFLSSKSFTFWIFSHLKDFHIFESLQDSKNGVTGFPSDTSCWKRSSILPRTCSIIIHCEKNTSVSSVGRKP